MKIVVEHNGNITYDTDNNFLLNVSQSERTRIDQNGTLSHGTTQDNPGDANSNTGFAIRANGKYFFSCAADGGHMNRNNAISSARGMVVILRRCLSIYSNQF